MKKIKNIVLALTLIFSFSVAISPALVVADTKSDLSTGANAAGGAGPKADAAGTLNTTVKDIVNLLSLIGGIAAVVVIIVGGFRMVTSGGSADDVKSSRNMIIYALAGLLVIALAQVIVRFVLQRTVT